MVEIVEVKPDNQTNSRKQQVRSRHNKAHAST